MTIPMLVAAALVAAVAAPSAQAARGQLTVMQDDALLLHNGPEARERALDEMRRLGADVVKVQLYWRDVAPGGRRRPAGFDATDPAGYSWGAYDQVVREIVDHGMRPFLAIGNRAPDWATRRVTRYRGTFRPKPRELRRFAEAVGTRYSGSYAGLPRVEIWSIWNEPNLYSWLSPQRRRGIPISPHVYRGLYLAAHRGLRASGHRRDTILLGELMPLGAGSRRKVPPLVFLREMACLNGRYRPFRGRAARIRRCGRRARRIPTSGLAYHPYTPRGGVRARPGRGEASISTLGRLVRVLNRVARRHRMPRRLPIWITEYGFQTNPPDPFQYRIGRVPAFMDESEWLAFRNRRVRSYAQYTLRDEPPRDDGSTFIRHSSFQMGLRFASGRAKRRVYRAFRMPVFVRVLGRHRVEVFGGLRGRSRGRVRIDARRRGGRYRPVARARLNRAGYFRRVVRVRRASSRRYRINIAGRSRVKRPVRR